MCQQLLTDYSLVDNSGKKKIHGQVKNYLDKKSHRKVLLPKIEEWRNLKLVSFIENKSGKKKSSEIWNISVFQSMGLKTY